MNEKCFLYKAVLEQQEETPVGWIGGYPPIVLEKDISSLNEDYFFYLTFILPIKEKKQISVFIPKSESYLDKNIYPNCAIKIIEHEISIEGNNEKAKIPFIIKHEIILTKECSDEEANKDAFLIKFGGNPRLIQNKSFYYKELLKDGYSFLMQIDEDGYPEGLLKGNAPLYWGSLYIYAKLDNKIYDILAGYWQST